MKEPEQIALDIVDRFSWSSNVVLNGRMVGQQCVVAMAIADAVQKERAEIKRLRGNLFKIQCEQLDRATNKRLTAIGHRRRAMATRNEILQILDADAGPAHE